MKTETRRDVIAHLRRHPGHSDRRVARLFDVAPSTVGRWRWEEALAPAVKSVGSRTQRELVTPRRAP